MKNLKTTVFIGLIAFLLPSSLFALNPSRRNEVDLIWSKRTNSRGLYTRSANTGGKYVSNGLTISLAANYYYGDVDPSGIAFKGGFRGNNVSGGLVATFAYTMPLSRHCNWRFGGGLGYLHGARTEEELVGNQTTRSFTSLYIEPAAGVEYYPFTRAGFYLYAGLGLNLNVRTKSNYGGVEGSPVSVLPIIPVEIGYDIRAGRSFLIRIFAGVHQGLLDIAYMNLDGYPIPGGEGTGKFSMNEWADGYFQVGVSVSYKWHNCEKCRQYNW